MKKIFKPRAWWIIVTPPTFNVNWPCFEMDDRAYQAGTATLFMKRKYAVSVAKTWVGAKVVKVYLVAAE